MAEVNSRIRRQTWAPAETPVEEQHWLHPVPEWTFTAGFWQSRRVGKDATTRVEAVPLLGAVRAVDDSGLGRFHGQDVIATAMVERQPVEVARHPSSTPGD